METKKDGKAVIFDRFETAAEMLEFCNRATTWKTKSSRRMGSNSSWWYASENYEHAEKLLAHGWKQGRERMSNLVSALNVRDKHLAQKKGYDVAGQIPHIARYVAGDPFHMGILYPDQYAQSPTLKIYVGLTVSAAISADEIFNRGAAILSVVDTLETQGVSCEIVAFWAGHDASVRMTGELVVKRAGDYYDIDKVAFILAHPSMLRRFVFACNEQYPHHERTWGGGYGSIDTAYKPSDHEDGQACMLFPNITSMRDFQWMKDPKTALAHIETLARECLLGKDC